MEWASANPLMILGPLLFFGACALLDRARYDRGMREYNRRCDEIDRMTERKSAEAHAAHGRRR
jgi:hypothetical protein